jgi:transcriptional regulator with XRE-family HTH domain
MNNIKRLREQKGISVRDLGTATNINSGTISRMENGNQQVTDVYAVALANYFKVSLDNLLGREWLDMALLTATRTEFTPILTPIFNLK